MPAGQVALEKFDACLRPQGFTIRAFTLDHQDPLFFKSGHQNGTAVLDVVLVNGHYSITGSCRCTVLGGCHDRRARQSRRYDPRVA